MVKCQDCKKTANYNYKNLESLYCGQHKKENMINTSHKRCLEENCEKMSSYNYKGKTTRLYYHKKDNMINIAGRLCKDNKCNKKCFI